MTHLPKPQLRAGLAAVLICAALGGPALTGPAAAQQAPEAPTSAPATPSPAAPTTYGATTGGPTTDGATPEGANPEVAASDTATPGAGAPVGAASDGAGQPSARGTAASPEAAQGTGSGSVIDPGEATTGSGAPAADAPAAEGPAAEGPGAGGAAPGGATGAPGTVDAPGGDATEADGIATGGAVTGGPATDGAVAQGLATAPGAASGAVQADAATGVGAGTAPAAGGPAAGGPAAGAPGDSAVEAPGDAGAVAGTGPGLRDPGLPHDLSPMGMYLAADWVVKAVMIGLAVASVITWTILVAKLVELAAASRRAASGTRRIRDAETLPAALTGAQSRRDPVARMIQTAAAEYRRSEPALGQAGDHGLKERVASQLERIEAAAGRRMARGTGVLATIGSTAPFVGLFGTVWGIMNSFIGISESQTTNLAVVAPGIAEALLATAIGLVAAIPAVVIYNVFARAVTGYRMRLGHAAAGVQQLVSRDLDFRGRAATGG